MNANSIIDVDTSPAAEIDALPEFIKSKMSSSEEWIGRMRHEENMRGGDGTKIEPPEIVKRHTPTVETVDADAPPF